MKFRDIYEEVSEKPKYVLYVDMDGVLTNFSKACKQIGVNMQDLDINPDLAFEKIDAAGEDFWSRMPPMDDYKILWNYISKYHPTILSAPSRNPNSKTGKRKWVDRELGSNVPAIFVPKKLKQKQCKGPNYILIDDHPGNIERWEKAGGIGILHPFKAQPTIDRLKELGL